MKNILFALLILISLPTMADNRIERVLKSPNVLKRIENFESEKKVDCIAPKEGQIHWMCALNNCYLALNITCVSRFDNLAANDQIVRLELLGPESAEGTFFKAKREIISEYKLIETK